MNVTVVAMLRFIFPNCRVIGCAIRFHIKAMMTFPGVPVMCYLVSSVVVACIQSLHAPMITGRRAMCAKKQFHSAQPLEGSLANLPVKSGWVNRHSDGALNNNNKSCL